MTHEVTMSLMITGWFACILAKVYHDHKKWGNIKHTAGTIVMIFVGILYAGIAFGVRRPDSYAQDVIIFMVTSYWIFMEGLLHVSVGQNWFYQGTTAKLDRFFRKNMPLYLGLKLAAAVLLVYSVVQLYKHG